MSAGEDPAYEADAPFSFSLREPWKNPGWREQCFDMVARLYPEPPDPPSPAHDFTCRLEDHYGPSGSGSDPEFSALLKEAPAGFWANPQNWAETIVELVHHGKAPQIAELCQRACRTTGKDQIMHGLAIAAFISELTLEHDDSDPSDPTPRLNALRMVRRIYTKYME
jgi:hypothetical protein